MLQLYRFVAGLFGKRRRILYDGLSVDVICSLQWQVKFEDTCELRKVSCVCCGLGATAAGRVVIPRRKSTCLRYVSIRIIQMSDKHYYVMAHIGYTMGFNTKPLYDRSTSGLQSSLVVDLWHVFPKFALQRAMIIADLEISVIGWSRCEYLGGKYHGVCYYSNNHHYITYYNDKTHGICITAFNDVLIYQMGKLVYNYGDN